LARKARLETGVGDLGDLPGLFFFFFFFFFLNYLRMYNYVISGLWTATSISHHLEITDTVIIKPLQAYMFS
jgi:hypothetical protein